MFIKSFEYEDLRTGWKLERAEFDAFNLLVGNSGVGKTQILRALTNVARMATATLAECVWSLEFHLEDRRYEWSGRVAEDVAAGQRKTLSDVNERLVQDGSTIFVRGGDAFTFHGGTLPHLSPELSGLRLLSGEASIRPLLDGFRRVLPIAEIPESPLKVPLDGRKGVNRSPSILESALALVHTKPTTWHQISETFQSIFPTVEEVSVHRFTDPEDGEDTIAVRLRERSSSAVIEHREIASGMRRTLGHLIELAIAPKDSIILIDEFENSLGANCMPEVVRLLNSRPDLQFIITSHHPYVINNIPKDTWKLVQRKGSTVHVTSARDIPALQDASHHQAYLRLVNLPEFEEGIA